MYSTPVATMEKKKGIGLVSCVTMIAGGMIGSAIFSLSGMTMYNAGASAIVSWAIAAVIMLIYGLVCAELSTIFPKSGGVFVFPSKALGKKPPQRAFACPVQSADQNSHSCSFFRPFSFLRSYKRAAWPALLKPSLNPKNLKLFDVHFLYSA